MSAILEDETASMEVPSVSPDEQDQKDVLPKLRFEDGDVIFQLSEDPTEHLLLHSSVLRAASTLFAASFKAEWASPKMVKHPLTGKDTPIYKLALSFAEKTFLLERKDFPDVGELPYYSTFFSQTIFSRGGWPDLDNWGLGKEVETHKVLQLTADDHTAIFAMLYGLPITLESMCGEYRSWPHREVPFFMLHVVDRLSNILAYAEYYECLPRIATVVTDMLLKTPDFWTAVADSPRPQKFLTLAKKLRHSGLYCDVLRNLLSSRAIPWELKAQCLGLPEPEAKQMYLPRLEALDGVIEDLRTYLLRLQLSQTSVRSYGNDVPVATSFLDLLRHKSKGRSETAKAMERFDFLARAIYGQWLVQQLHGENVFPGLKAYPAGNLNSACNKLVKAAESDDPTKLFGFKVSSRFACMFQLGRKHSPEGRVKESLVQIVRQAAEYIHETFKIDISESQPYLVCRSAPYGDGLHYKTYMPIDESDVPWSNERPWEKCSELPSVSMKEASELWLDTVGLGAEKEQE